MAEPLVLDVAEWGRIEIHSAGRLAGFVNHRLGRGEITFTHTGIDDALRGRGRGGTLARGAACRRRLAVLPECPFVHVWIADHPGYADLVPAAEHARSGLS